MVPNADDKLARAIRSNFLHDDAVTIPGIRSARPKLGGEANFLKAHLALVELLDQIQAAGVHVRIRDDSRYAKHRDVDRLLRSLRDWDAIVAKFVGSIADALADEPGSLIAPIKDRPDFEHLEAKGITVLKRMAARQRRRKKKGSS